MPTLAPGQRFGPYELIEPIGAGGMGEVWKARDTRLDRIVAVKFSQARFNERFEREARSIAALNHPNIATLHDVGEDYIVMEYVEGGPIKALPDDPRKLLDTAVQIADGLAAAHAAGFVHRDLKPDNILLSKSGRVKILDFGLAKQAGGDRITEHDATRTFASNPGSVIGTAAYMSPEQARGEELDQRSDQFSFGLILYELASGKRPFHRASAAETMTAIIREDAAPLPPSVPAPLRWVVERLLSKDPEERYASTKDLWVELRSLRGRLTETLPTAAPAAPRRRHYGIAAAAAGVLALVAFTAALRFPRSTAPAPELKYTPFATDSENEDQPAWSPNGGSLAYVRAVNGVRQIFIRALDAPTPVQITAGEVGAQRPFWSPDGARVYFSRGQDVFFTGATGGSAQLFLKDAAAPVLSRDGKRLAYSRREGTTVFYLADGDGSHAVRFQAKGLPDVIRSGLARFSPDSSKVALLMLTRAGPEDTRILWVAPASGKGEPIRSPANFDYFAAFAGAPDWSPDGRALIVASGSESGTDAGETHLYRIDIATGERRLLTAGPVVSELEPAVSPDGKRIAVTVQTSDSDVYEFSTETGRGRAVVAGSRDDSAGVWMPSGKEFAYATEVGGRVRVWLQSENGISRPLPLSGPEVRNIQEITVSPDGQRIGLDSYGRPHKTMIVSSAGGVPVQLDPANQDTHGAAFSPDGASIVYSRFAQGGGRMAKVSSAGGEPIDLGAIGRTPGHVTQWSPSGDSIAYVAEAGGESALMLMSPDGKDRRTILKKGYRDWSFDRDGKRIFGLKRGEGRRWQLWAVDIATGVERKIVELDASPRVDLFRLNLHPDGKRFLTSVRTFAKDIWIIDGAALN